MRAKQLLMSHGPGSILETIGGPVVIRTFDSLHGSLQNLPPGVTFPESFEIIEPRLSSLLPSPSGASSPRLHSVPSNADLGWRENRYIVQSNSFPNWLICQSQNHRDGVLYQGRYDNSECPHPDCQETGNAVRFVSYCKAGHIDDVSWRWALHEGPAGCSAQYINWTETDSSSTGIRLSCPDPACNASRSLREISNSTFRCNGRSPESEFGGQQRLPTQCTETPKVVPRQSTIIWQPILQTVISVPKEDTMKKLVSEFFGTMVRNGARLHGNVIQPNGHHAQFEDLFEEPKMVNLPQPEDEDTRGLLSHIWHNLRWTVEPHRRQRLVHLCRLIVSEGLGEFTGHWESLETGGDIDTTRSSFRMEHDSLTEEIENPSEMRDPSTGRVIFRMEERSITADFGPLRILARPVPLLRTVTSLTGYTRGSSEVGDDQPQMISLGHELHGSDWYASMEAFGEGLLLKLADGSPSLHEGERYEEWSRFHEKVVHGSQQDPPSVHIPWTLFRSAGAARRINEEWVPPQDSADEYFSEAHPSFVWWHTFAHHLIRSVQADTGYSSSSIRERIYSVPNQSGKWEGAVLLHVTDGMDGTLGGLTSLLPNLQTFLDGAKQTALLCSNDPLCEEGVASIMPQRGCYACTLNPETSCEHRNMFLDRLLLVEGAEL